MTESPENSNTTRHTSPGDSESSSGFRSFWKRSDRASQNQDVKFVPQDPSNSQNGSRISRFWKTLSPSSSNPEEDEGSSRNGIRKRREQVYQAQKRHRNRKAEYVQNLEAEVARLQQLDATVNSEKATLAHQNNAIKKLLASHSIDAHLDSLELSSFVPTEDLDQLGSAAIDIRYDSDVGHERMFVDYDDMVWTSTEGATGANQPQQPHQAPIKSDSWAALDFILALEWPCKDHIKHDGIYGITQTSKNPILGEFHGHALTATASVCAKAQPAPATIHGKANAAKTNVADPDGSHPNNLDKWQLSHSEIDKLVKLSEALELDDEIMTPAQAYSAIRKSLPNDELLQPTLESMKKSLGHLVQCQGFGSSVDTQLFWHHLFDAVPTLQST